MFESQGKRHEFTISFACVCVSTEKDTNGLPIKKRATYNVNTFDANTVNKKLTIYGTEMIIAAFFRPSLSDRMPHGKAPQIAPMANIDATHVACSLVALIVGSLINCSCAGELHANPVPAAAAPKQTDL